MDLLPNVEFDTNVRYVDKLPNLQTPSYLELDLRLAWRPRKNLELALVGQNLLQDRHAEFSRTFVNIPRTEIERSFFGKITWRF
jgi:iron complex outermembrane receptor protein